MRIGSISEKIFKTPSNKIENNSNQTNPFGVSFKGNIINADVFESSEKSNISFKGAELAAKAGAKCKMLTSALVGSMGNMNFAISKRLNSVVDLGRKMKEKVTGAWKYLNETSLAINFDIRPKSSNNPFGVSLSTAEDLREKPVSKLGDMLQATIAEREAA